MTAVLDVAGLTAGYGRAAVLRDVTFALGDEILGVLGANGAGKTTLLRTLSGNVRPDAGSIVLRGEPLGRATPWSRARRGLAHVPEGRHVFGALTVDDNLDVAALTGRERRFTKERVFDLFPRLRERRTQAAGSLSGGEQQMLVIGRALLTGPSVLLVDELSAGLAPVTARELVESLAAIHREGVAMVLVEQSPRLIADIVDRVLVLEHGTIGAQGTMDDIGGADGLAERYLAAR